MARRLLRAMLWGLKGVLLLVAAAALFAWPWSYGHPGKFWAQRWTVGTERTCRFAVYGGMGDGQVGIGGRVENCEGESRQRAVLGAALDGPGWTGQFQPESPAWIHESGPSSLGPFRWDFSEDSEYGRTTACCEVSLPCWLLSASAGAWPVWSIGLLVRRRRRSRRRSAAGRCDR